MLVYSVTETVDILLAGYGSYSSRSTWNVSVLKHRSCPQTYNPCYLPGGKVSKFYYNDLKSIANNSAPLSNSCHNVKRNYMYRPSLLRRPTAGRLGISHAWWHPWLITQSSTSTCRAIGLIFLDIYCIQMRLNALEVFSEEKLFYDKLP